MVRLTPVCNLLWWGSQIVDQSDINMIHEERLFQLLLGCPVFEFWVRPIFPLVQAAFPCVRGLSLGSQPPWLGYQKKET